MSFTTPEQPVTPGQDQQVTPDPTPAAPSAAQPPAAPAAQTPAPGPWSADLERLFPDPAVRGQVDQYIRGSVQPRVTQLEQEAAAARDAMRLWNDLGEAPLDTYQAITREMFGDAEAERVMAALQTQQPAQQGQPVAPPQPGDPRFDEVYNWYQSTQNENYYNSELNRIKDAHPEIHEPWFHKYVATANGNFDEAYLMYSHEMNEIRQQLGVTEPPAPVAPAAIGSDVGSAAPASTPVERTYASLDDAINDFMAEQRAARQAPPVGSI